MDVKIGELEDLFERYRSYLLLLAQAWPHLPEALRAGIVAMVRAAQQTEKS